MILKITNNGERITFTDENILNLPTLDNVLMIGKGIVNVIEDLNVRQALLQQFGLNGEIYILSPEEKDMEQKVLIVKTPNSMPDHMSCNILNEIDLNSDLVPTVLDRFRKEE